MSEYTDKECSIVIGLTTQRRFNLVKKSLKKMGFKWGKEVGNVKLVFKDFKEQTCIRIHTKDKDIHYSSKDFYEDSDYEVSQIFEKSPMSDTLKKLIMIEGLK